MMSFNDFTDKHKLKKKAISNIKIYQVLSSLSLNEVVIYLRDGPFSSDIGIVKLQPYRGTHWVAYINEFFYSFGCSPPQKLYRFVIKRNVHRLYSGYKKQSLTNRKDSYCASFCLYLIFLT